ncbi:uncharacterized protein UV8b_04868 [Ustilaginoidea virens]|uniref:Chromo domain-containing protein n=1 Tax=Ustilaginoidea virens TaxID=1159556 RepID=A0A8E5MI45_USTVR|nr:uncharacterized protein UV8b_04868 [Ustilaginoidea virens]QUC20627.1 hypothetical protein UV8b_04868 [Ustilaginoidea virens]
MDRLIASVFPPREASEQPEASSTPGSRVRLAKQLRRKLPQKTKAERHQNASHPPSGPKPSSKIMAAVQITLEPKLHSVPCEPPTTQPFKSPAQASASSPSQLAQNSSANSRPRLNIVIEPSLSPAASPGANDDIPAQQVEYPFNRLSDHRWAGNSIEIQVEWENGECTWEKEAILHQDAPEALLGYWKTIGGRPTNEKDPDLFDIHAIRKHSRNGKSLLVEWVGYGPEDATWVPQAVLQETAPDAVVEYWKSVKAAKRVRKRHRRGSRN